MARYIEGESERKRAELRESLDKTKSTATDLFGRDLGNPFFNYSYHHDINLSRELDDRPLEHGKIRRAFAQAVVNALEKGTTEEKTNALTALLTSVELKIIYATRPKPTY